MTEGDGQPRLTKWNCENDGHEWTPVDGGVLCARCRHAPTGADVLALAQQVRDLTEERDALKNGCVELLGMM